MKTNDPLDLDGPAAKSTNASHLNARKRKASGGRIQARGIVEGVQDRVPLHHRAPALPALALEDGHVGDHHFLPAEDLADCLDFEHASLASDELDEMEHMYADDASRMGAETEFPIAYVGVHDGEGAGEVHMIDEAGETELLEKSMSVGLGEHESVGDPGQPSDLHISAPGSSTDVTPPPEPWECLPCPAESGYVYQDGRHIMRIQRNKPCVGSTTVNCYKHPRCSIVVKIAK